MKRLEKILTVAVLVIFSAESLFSAVPDYFSGSLFKDNCCRLSEAYRAETGKFVVVVEDAHNNFTVQKNILALIEAYCKRMGNGKILVGLEGASGDIDLSDISNYPLAKARKMAAESLIGSGYISGAEASAIEMGKFIIPFGVEDRNIFYKDLNLYIRLNKDKRKALDIFSKIDDEITELRKDVYKGELLEFDNMFRAFKEGNPDSGGFYEFILHAAMNKTELLEDFVNLKLFMEVESLKERVDRNELYKRLKEFNLISDGDFWNDIEKLVNLSKTRGRKDSFYGFISEIYRKKRLIDDSVLLREFTDFCYRIEEKLAGTERERILVELGRRERLVKDLIEIKADRGEVERLGVTDSFTYFFRIFEYFFDIAGLISKTENDFLKRYLNGIDKFYELAKLRERKIVENLQRKMESSDAPFSFLVVGGFHSEGILNELKNKGISYLLAVPNIDEADIVGAYEDRMSGKLVPFDLPFISYITLSIFEISGRDGEAILKRMFSRYWTEEVASSPSLAAKVLILRKIVPENVMWQKELILYSAAMELTASNNENLFTVLSKNEWEGRYKSQYLDILNRMLEEDEDKITTLMPERYEQYKNKLLSGGLPREIVDKTGYFLFSVNEYYGDIAPYILHLVEYGAVAPESFFLAGRYASFVEIEDKSDDIIRDPEMLNKLLSYFVISKNTDAVWILDAMKDIVKKEGDAVRFQNNEISNLAIKVFDTINNSKSKDDEIPFIGLLFSFVNYLYETGYDDSRISFVTFLSSTKLTIKYHDIIDRVLHYMLNFEESDKIRNMINYGIHAAYMQRFFHYIRNSVTSVGGTAGLIIKKELKKDKGSLTAKRLKEVVEIAGRIELRLKEIGKFLPKWEFNADYMLFKRLSEVGRLIFLLRDKVYLLREKIETDYKIYADAIYKNVDIMCNKVNEMAFINEVRVIPGGDMIKIVPPGSDITVKALVSVPFGNILPSDIDVKIWPKNVEGRAIAVPMKYIGRRGKYFIFEGKYKPPKKSESQFIVSAKMNNSWYQTSKRFITETNPYGYSRVLAKGGEFMKADDESKYKAYKNFGAVIEDNYFEITRKYTSITVEKAASILGSLVKESADNGIYGDKNMLLMLVSRTIADSFKVTDKEIKQIVNNIYEEVHFSENPDDFIASEEYTVPYVEENDDNLGEDGFLFKPYYGDNVVLARVGLLGGIDVVADRGALEKLLANKNIEISSDVVLPMLEKRINRMLERARAKLLAEGFFREEDFDVEIVVEYGLHKSAQFSDKKDRKVITLNWHSFKNADFLYIVLKHELMDIYLNNMDIDIPPPLRELYSLINVNVKEFMKLIEGDGKRASDLLAVYKDIAIRNKGLYKIYEKIYEDSKSGKPLPYDYFKDIVSILAEESYYDNELGKRVYTYWPSMQNLAKDMFYDDVGYSEVKAAVIKVRLKLLNREIKEYMQIRSGDKWRPLDKYDGKSKVAKLFSKYKNYVWYIKEGGYIYIKAKVGEGNYVYLLFSEKDEPEGIIGQRGKFLGETFDGLNRSWNYPIFFADEDTVKERQREKNYLYAMPLSSLRSKLARNLGGVTSLISNISEFCGKPASKLNLNKIASLNKKSKEYGVLTRKIIPSYLNKIYRGKICGYIDIYGAKVSKLKIWPMSEIDADRQIVSWLLPGKEGKPPCIYNEFKKASLDDVLDMLASYKKREDKLTDRLGVEKFKLFLSKSGFSAVLRDKYMQDFIEEKAGEIYKKRDYMGMAYIIANYDNKMLINSAVKLFHSGNELHAFLEFVRKSAKRLPPDIRAATLFDTASFIEIVGRAIDMRDKARKKRGTGKYKKHIDEKVSGFFGIMPYFLFSKAQHDNYIKYVMLAVGMLIVGYMAKDIFKQGIRAVVNLYSEKMNWRLKLPDNPSIEELLVMASKVMPNEKGRGSWDAFEEILSEIKDNGGNVLIFCGPEYDGDFQVDYELEEGDTYFDIKGKIETQISVNHIPQFSNDNMLFAVCALLENIVQHSPSSVGVVVSYKRRGADVLGFLNNVSGFYSQNKRYVNIYKAAIKGKSYGKNGYYGEGFSYVMKDYPDYSFAVNAKEWQAFGGYINNDRGEHGKYKGNSFLAVLYFYKGYKENINLWKKSLAKKVVRLLETGQWYLREKKGDVVPHADFDADFRTKMHDLKNKIIPVLGFKAILDRKNIEIPGSIKAFFSAIKPFNKLSEIWVDRKKTAIIDGKKVRWDGLNVEMIRDIVSDNIIPLYEAVISMENSDFSCADDKVKDYAPIFIQSGNWIVKILNDIILMNGYSIAPVKLKEFFSNVLSEVEKSTELKIGLDVENKIVFVPCDLLSIAVDEILHNAFKYAYGKEDTDKRIDIRAFVNNNNELVVEIKDYGKGVKKEDLEKIWNVGVTEGSANTKSLGEGLPGIKRRIEYVLGSLDVESEAGKGSLFRIKLPVLGDLGESKKDYIASIYRKRPIINICGLIGSGREVVAVKLASELGFRYINTEFVARMMFFLLMRDIKNKVVNVNLDNPNEIVKYFKENFNRIDMFSEPLKVKIDPDGDYINTVEKFGKYGNSLRKEIKNFSNYYNSELFYRIMSYKKVKDIFYRFITGTVDSALTHGRYNGVVLRSTDIMKNWNGTDIINVFLDAPVGVRERRTERSDFKILNNIALKDGIEAKDILEGNDTAKCYIVDSGGDDMSFTYEMVVRKVLCESVCAKECRESGMPVEFVVDFLREGIKHGCDRLKVDTSDIIKRGDVYYSDIEVKYGNNNIWVFLMILAIIKKWANLKYMKIDKIGGKYILKLRVEFYDIASLDEIYDKLSYIPDIFMEGRLNKNCFDVVVNMLGKSGEIYDMVALFTENGIQLNGISVYGEYTNFSILLPDNFNDFAIVEKYVEDLLSGIDKRYKVFNIRRGDNDIAKLYTDISEELADYVDKIIPYVENRYFYLLYEFKNKYGYKWKELLLDDSLIKRFAEKGMEGDADAEAVLKERYIPAYLYYDSKVSPELEKEMFDTCYGENCDKYRDKVLDKNLVSRVLWNIGFLKPQGLFLDDDDFIYGEIVKAIDLIDDTELRSMVKDFFEADRERFIAGLAFLESKIKDFSYSYFMTKNVDEIIDSLFAGNRKENEFVARALKSISENKELNLNLYMTEGLARAYPGVFENLFDSFAALGLSCINIIDNPDDADLIVALDSDLWIEKYRDRSFIFSSKIDSFGGEILFFRNVFIHILNDMSEGKPLKTVLKDYAGSWLDKSVLGYSIREVFIEKLDLELRRIAAIKFIKTAA